MQLNEKQWSRRQRRPQRQLLYILMIKDTRVYILQEISFRVQDHLIGFHYFSILKFKYEVSISCNLNDMVIVLQLTEIPLKSKNI